MITILIVEDDQEFAGKCIEHCLSLKLNSIYCSNAEEAKLRLLEEKVNIILIDLMLPPQYQYEGLNLLRHIKNQYPEIEPFLMTSKDSKTTEIVSEAMKLGAHYFFDKNSENFDKTFIYRLKEMLVEKSHNIFLSHGNNQLLKLKLKDFLQNKINKVPVTLSDQPGAGLTKVEQLEKATTNCCFAVILMTKDDFLLDGSVRVKQDIVHEVGFCQGKFGRTNVVLLAERGVELFKNISGIICIEFEENAFEAVFEYLRLEIQEAFKRK